MAMTRFGWRKRHAGIASGSPYDYVHAPRPTAGAEGFTFQHPQIDPLYQIQGPGSLVPFHFRVFQPQKWSVQTVILAGIPATIGTFDLSELTDANGRPYA